MSRFPVEISARFLQIAGVRCRLDIVRDITKRKRAEAALQESEERYRSLFSSSLDAVLLTMPDGRILAANEAACHIFGFSEEELIQVGRSAIVDASDTKLSAALAERAQSGRFIGELTLVRRDGSKFPGEISSAEFRNRAGELRTSMVIRDITERKQAEELLRIQHDLALAFSNASRLKEGLRLCLEAVLNILGMECGGFYLVDRTSGALDLAFHQGLSPGFVKAVAHYAADSANAKLVMAGKPVYGEYPVFRVPLSEAMRHEGLRAVAIVPVSHQAQVIGCLNIASHRPGEVPASARAVLEAVVAQTGAAIVRLRAEEVLRASERKFHTLADNFPEIIARFDRQLRHIYVSPSVEQYAGLPIKAFQGKTNEELGMPPENVPLWIKRLRRVFKSGERESFEFEFRKAGRLQVFASLLVPEFGKDGAVESVMGIIRDISERKRAEERVRMFAQEIIAAREEERKEVASVLHHDVGSLAVGISAYLDLMEEHIRSGKPGEALKLMRRTRKLFYQSVARLKGLAVELRPPELDAIGLCGALRQYFSPSPRHGDTRIHFKETLGRRRVPAGSATILFRVAQEALTNAIAHGRAQQVNVDLRASKEAVTLTVHDNGKGFDPSEQMAHPTSHMGLRVMREMALSAGGDFTIDSGRGKGTTLRVRLPIADRGLRNAECGLKEMSNMSPPSEMIRNPQSAIRNRLIRVILADDHPVVRDGLRLTIERSGKDIAVVGEAADGLEVLEAARTTRADVFILDITMPNLNGIETARELLKRMKAAKVIILSLHSTKAMVEAALAAGARGYLTKEMAHPNRGGGRDRGPRGTLLSLSMVAHFVVEAGFLGRKGSRQPRAIRVGLTGQERKVLQLHRRRPEQQGNRRPAGPVRQHHSRPPEQRDGQAEPPQAGRSRPLRH